ncbi:MAG: DegV protein [Bacillales bacterium]|jgi:DegV family protein with EDD domain|nr:DegV protein [Bacillales bacterium]
MKQVKIVTDSTADISRELIEKYEISVVPLNIHINNVTYIDGVNITPMEFIEKMRLSNELPKTSQPSIGKFVETYEHLGKDDFDIISIHLTSGMSGTFNSAKTASDMVSNKVYVFDTQFMSMAEGYFVIEAAKLASEGKTALEIIEFLEEMRNKVRLFVVVDTLDNLVKGGRIGKGKALLSSILNIKPIAMLENGVYAPVAKVRSYGQIIKYLTNFLVEDTEGKQIKKVNICHADSLQLAKKLKDSIQNVFNQIDVEIGETSPIISTHTGPGAIGFFYYTE